MDKNDLAQAFCHDCNKRRLRVSEIVQGGMPLNRVQLDQLHQEFDTLYGGARAVHLPDLERFFRGMARYARYLRNRQRLGLEVGPQSWQRLMLGVEIWFRCSAELSCCFVYSNSNSDRLPLLQEMENKIDNGDAK